MFLFVFSRIPLKSDARAKKREKIERKNVCKFCLNYDAILLKFCEWSGAKEYQSDRSRQELSNEYLIAKIGFDTAENEPLKVWITDLSDHILDHIPSLL